jgi:hypothetical protein
MKNEVNKANTSGRQEALSDLIGTLDWYFACEARVVGDSHTRLVKLYVLVCYLRPMNTRRTPRTQNEVSKPNTSGRQEALSDLMAHW